MKFSQSEKSLLPRGEGGQLKFSLLLVGGGGGEEEEELTEKMLHLEGPGFGGCIICRKLPLLLCKPR